LPMATIWSVVAVERTVARDGFWFWWFGIEGRVFGRAVGEGWNAVDGW